MAVGGGNTTTKSEKSGLKFNLEKVDSDRAKGQYTFVSRTGKGGKRSLSGAPAQWAEEPRLAYNDEFRIVGLPEDVTAALTAAGVSSADIKRLYMLDFDAYSTAEGREYYEQLVAADKTSKANQTEYNWSLEQLKEFLASDRTIEGGKADKAKTCRGKTARRSTNVSLMDRLGSLAADEWLDVSKLNTENGTGTRKVSQPKRKLYMTEPRITADKYEAFVAALRYAYGEDLRAYADDLQDLKARFDAQGTKKRGKKAAASPKSKKAASPKTPKSASPKKVPSPKATTPKTVAGATMSARPIAKAGTPTRGVKVTGRPARQ